MSQQPHPGLQQRLWRALRQHGPCTIRALAEAPELAGIGQREPLKNAMRALVARGAAERVPESPYRAPEYRALGNRPPLSRKGKHPNSRNFNREKYFAWVLRNSGRMGARWHVNPERRKVHPLEQAWQGVKA